MSTKVFVKIAFFSEIMTIDYEMGAVFCGFQNYY